MIVASVLLVRHSVAVAGWRPDASATLQRQLASGPAGLLDWTCLMGGRPLSQAASGMDATDQRRVALQASSVVGGREKEEKEEVGKRASFAELQPWRLRRDNAHRIHDRLLEIRLRFHCICMYMVHWA